MFYYETFIEPITIKQIEQILREKNYKVLNDMELIEVDKKMKKVSHNSAFSEVLGRNVTLKSSSNALKNILDEEANMMAKEQREKLIELSSKRPLKLESTKSENEINKFRENIKKVKSDFSVTSTPRNLN